MKILRTLLLFALSAALLLAGQSDTLAADPWEFETEAQLASANADFQRTTSMRSYEKAQELIKKGGPKAYEDAIRRLRWSISREPDSGVRRDKIRRWKKVDYFPYYHLALIFAWQGDWNSSLRSIQREDTQAIENSSFSVGYQRFMNDLDKVLARGRLVHMVGELLQWRADGTPVSIDAAHEETLLRIHPQAAALAEKPAGPWRGGHDAEPAALAQQIGQDLMTIYRLELGSRKRALEELVSTPWQDLLGPTTPIPSPASCDYQGNDLKHARDRLRGCAEITNGVMRLAASKACAQQVPQGGKKVPAWCATPNLAPWHEIAALVGRPDSGRAATRRPAATPPSPEKKKPARRKAKAQSERAQPERTPPAKPVTTDLAKTPVNSGLSQQTHADHAAATTPPAAQMDREPTGEAPADQAPTGRTQPGGRAITKPAIAAKPLLRRIFRLLEDGGLDRAIEQLREADADGVFPREGHQAALCRMTFAYALFLKLPASPEGSGEGAQMARAYLQAEIDQQLDTARQIAPGLTAPPELFPGFPQID